MLGAKVILILSLITDILSIQFYVSADLSDQPSNVLVFMKLNLAKNLICVLFDVVAIFGFVYLKKPGCLVGWLIIHMIELILSTITHILKYGLRTVFFIWMLFEYQLTRDHVNPYLDEFYSKTKLMEAFYNIGLLVAVNLLSYYFWNIVRSAKNELLQENGRACALESGNKNSAQKRSPAKPPQYQV